MTQQLHSRTHPSLSLRQTVVAVASTALALAIGVATASAQEAARFDWMPPEAVSDATRGSDSGEQIIPEIIVIDTPMPTADKSKFTERYEIELEKFGISNDGTNPQATGKGINEALQHAKSIGANYVVFPEGTYLIDAVNHPILIDLTHTIIDLNGATLKAQTDGDDHNTLVSFIPGADTVRLTNGILRGDKDNGQGGTGLNFNGGYNIEADNLQVYDFQMDGLSSSTTGALNREQLLARIVASVHSTNLEAGGFDDSGAPEENAEKTRTIEPYDMTKANGEFEVGYTVGYQGYPQVNGRVYQAYYYDADMNFISMAKLLQFHKAQLPENVKFMHLEFNQPDVKGDAQNLVVRITNFTPSVKVHVHDVLMEGNKRLGFAMCGGQQWVIENNQFVGNGGRPPAYGVDFEDGWELVQHIVFRGNKFKDNAAGDLVVVSGSELIFEDNEFEKNVVTWGRPHNYIYRNNRFNGSNVTYTTRTGVAEIHGNHYEGGRLRIVFDTKAVADGLYRKPGETVATPPLVLKNETLNNVQPVSGTYFNFQDSTLNNVRFVAGEETRMIHFKNIKATNTTIQYEAEGPPVMKTMENVEGNLKEEGPGLSRRQAMPD